MDREEQDNERDPEGDNEEDESHSEEDSVPTPEQIPLVQPPVHMVSPRMQRSRPVVEVEQSLVSQGL